MENNVIETPREHRKNLILEAAEGAYPREMNTDTNQAFIDGCNWSDEHPNGFINDYAYLSRIRRKAELTNKDFIEILKQYPEDAIISVECCNPRAIVYDEKYNLIRID